MQPARGPLAALALAGLALLVLAAAPHAYLVDETADGTTSQMRFWWDQVSWDLEHEAVPGAGALYGALGVATLFVGSLLAWLGTRRERQGLALAGLATTFTGAVVSVHYAALWTGRTLTTLVHLMAGFDAPAALLRTTPFTPDAYSSVWVLAPVAVLGLALAAVIVQARGLAAGATGQFDARDQSGRHLRAAWMSLVVLAVLFAVPLSAQALPDNLGGTGAEVDDDTFWFSAYDTFRIHEGTTRAAQETHRGDLVEYDDLGRLLWIAFSAVWVVGAASVLGHHGATRAAQGDRNLGNLWQNTVFAGAAANVVLFGTVLLTALWLHRPNPDIDDRGTLVAIAAVVPVFLGLMGQIAVMRQLGRESGTLLADDFAEPILYD